MTVSFAIAGRGPTNSLPQLSSKIDRASEAFAENRRRMLEKIDEFRSLEAKVRARSERERPRFESRGQLMPRERVEVLLDPGRPFLALSTLAGLRMHDDDGLDEVYGGGMIVGIGYVSGVRSVVIANDSAIKGGTSVPMGTEKTLRAQEIALVNKLPVVQLVESGGGNLFRQEETFVRGGRKFFNQARLSAAGVPQITVVHGSSTAGGAYVPGMSDYVIMVRGRAKVFLAGPPLLKAATGEIATDEELGGAHMHATVAGTAEWIAEDDADALAIARTVMESLFWNDALAPGASATGEPPAYPVEDLVGLVPASHKIPYDVREVIARIVDGSRFLEFKETYDTYTVCGRARIEGLACALIGNNGPITHRGATKAAQFIQQCCQTHTPIIYLQNTTGYLVGREAEAGGIVKHGSKMIQAVANASVPQLTVILGGSFGAGNYGMCGRSFDPRFLFSWPNARIAVMGGEQAARVLSTVSRAKQERRGMDVDEEALARLESEIVDKYDRVSGALYATARLWDDGIIDPRDTRRVLGFCLSIVDEAERRRTFPTDYGVARF